MIDISVRFSTFWNLSVLMFLFREIVASWRRDADSPEAAGWVRGYGVFLGNAIFMLTPIAMIILSDSLQVAASRRANTTVLIIYFLSDLAGIFSHPGLGRVLRAVLLGFVV